MDDRRIGVHTSIAGGIYLSLARAKELGCTTMQIFSHNPRQWAVGELSPADIFQFKKLRKSYDIRPVFIHSSYLINLCAVDSSIYEKSVLLLMREMDLADSLGADFVVLHPGSAAVDSGNSALTKAANALEILARRREWKSQLLLENTAGEKGDISSRMEELSRIIDRVPGRLIGGICLDSCHAFQAGYDISRPEGVMEIGSEIERHIGRNKVKLIHLNDSKRRFNSKVDRHEHIGRGSIGIEGLRLFAGSDYFKSVPLILETPRDEKDDDARNLSVVREFLQANPPADNATSGT